MQIPGDDGKEFVRIRHLFQFNNPFFKAVDSVFCFQYEIAFQLRGPCYRCINLLCCLRINSRLPAFLYRLDGLSHRQAVKQLPRNVPINIILAPMEGDPMAASGFWQLAQVSRGSFLAPSKDWP